MSLKSFHMKKHMMTLGVLRGATCPVCVCVHVCLCVCAIRFVEKLMQTKFGYEELLKHIGSQDGPHAHTHTHTHALSLSQSIFLFSCLRPLREGSEDASSDVMMSGGAC